LPAAQVGLAPPAPTLTEALPAAVLDRHLGGAAGRTAEADLDIGRVLRCRGDVPLVGRPVRRPQAVTPPHSISLPLGVGSK
jgi:hypothetical protein